MPHVMNLHGNCIAMNSESLKSASMIHPTECDLLQAEKRLRMVELIIFPLTFFSFGFGFAVAWAWWG